MESRLNYAKLSPKPYQALLALQQTVTAGSIEPALYHLVVLRASQINNCAFCIDMHTKDAHALGENEQRIFMLQAWREVDLYSDRERAAFAWTESVTKLDDHVPDALYEETRRHLTDQEIADLTFIIATINTWNRLGISFRSPAGRYKPPHAPKPADA